MQKHVELSVDSSRVLDRTSLPETSASILVGAVVLLTALAVYGLSSPNPMLLPHLSLIKVAGGFIAAGAVLVAARMRGTTARDALTVPALLVFFGFVCAILSDPDEVARAMGLAN